MNATSGRQWSRRIAAALTAVGLGLVATAGVASAHESTGTHSDIQYGSTGVAIGDAWFDRADDGDGTETLNVHFHLDEGWSIGESHLCVEPTPFTERIAPGQCDAQAAADVTDYAFDLDDDYVGGPVCVQLHVVAVPDEGEEGVHETAFAGWVDGQPFYGNVCLPDGGDETNPAVPSASMSQCNAVGQARVVRVVLNNGADADEDAVFTVLVNGVAQPNVTVAPGGSESRDFTQTEDVAMTVKVESGAYSLEQTFDGNCALPVVVQDTTVTQSNPTTPTTAAVEGAQLARTGPITPGLLVAAGVAFLLGGMALGGSTLAPAHRKQ